MHDLPRREFRSDEAEECRRLAGGHRLDDGQGQLRWGPDELVRRHPRAAGHEFPVRVPGSERRARVPDQELRGRQQAESGAAGERDAARRGKAGESAVHRVLPDARFIEPRDGRRPAAGGACSIEQPHSLHDAARQGWQCLGRRSGQSESAGQARSANGRAEGLRPARSEGRRPRARHRSRGHHLGPGARGHASHEGLPAARIQSGDRAVATPDQCRSGRCHPQSQQGRHARVGRRFARAIST